MSLTTEQDGLWVDLIYTDGICTVSLRVPANEFALVVDAEIERRKEAARLANEMEPIDV